MSDLQIDGRARAQLGRESVDPVDRRSELLADPRQPTDAGLLLGDVPERSDQFLELLLAPRGTEDAPGVAVHADAILAPGVQVDLTAFAREAHHDTRAHLASRGGTHVVARIESTRRPHPLPLKPSGSGRGLS